MKTQIMAGLLAGVVLALPAGEARANTAIADDAKWVARFDMEKFKQTRTAQLLSEQIDDKAEKKFAAFKALFQFDPRDDLRDLTAYGFGKAEDDGVIVVRGRFNPNHLAVLLQANEDYVAHSHNAHTIHSWIDDKERAKARRANRDPKRAYGVFVDASTVVAGAQLESVANALDVQTGRQAGLSVEQWFGDLAHLKESPVFVAGARLAEIAHATPHAALLQQSRAAMLHVDEREGQIGVWIMLEAEKPELVEALSQVASGLIGLWQIKAESLGFERHLARLARVKADGKRLTVHSGISAEALFENLQLNLGR